MHAKWMHETNAANRRAAMLTLQEAASVSHGAEAENRGVSDFQTVRLGTAVQPPQQERISGQNISVKQAM